MPILVLSSLVWFNLVIFWFGLIWFYIIWCVTIVQICYHEKSGACSFKNIRVLQILVLFGFCMVWFGYVIFWFGLVWFRIIWRLTIGQICYHAKSGACSFKIVRVMPILVYFGLLWFGLVIFRFGLVWFCIIWCVTILQICYHTKSGACSLKNDRVMPILV